MGGSLNSFASLESNSVKDTKLEGLRGGAKMEVSQDGTCTLPSSTSVDVEEDLLGQMVTNRPDERKVGGGVSCTCIE